MKKFYSHRLECNVQQVSIRKAARLFNEGETIYIIACNMRFDNPWSFPCPASKKDSYEDDFYKYVDDFIYYNCDSERGKYPNYYVKC